MSSTSPSRAAQPAPPAGGTADVTSAAAVSTSRPARMWAGRFLLKADTDAGACGPLAASADCRGPEDYRRTLRRRYRDPAERQHLLCLARALRGSGHRDALIVTGPWAGEARAILTALETAHEPTVSPARRARPRVRGSGRDSALPAL